MSKPTLREQGRNFVSFQFAKLLAATSFFSKEELLPPQAIMAASERKVIGTRNRPPRNLGTPFK